MGVTASTLAHFITPTGNYKQPLLQHFQKRAAEAFALTSRRGHYRSSEPPTIYDNSDTATWTTALAGKIEGTNLQFSSNVLKLSSALHTSLDSLARRNPEWRAYHAHRHPPPVSPFPAVFRDDPYYSQQRTCPICSEQLDPESFFNNMLHLLTTCTNPAIRTARSKAIDNLDVRTRAIGAPQWWSSPQPPCSPFPKLNEIPEPHNVGAQKLWKTALQASSVTSASRQSPPPSALSIHSPGEPTYTIAGAYLRHFLTTMPPLPHMSLATLRASFPPITTQLCTKTLHPTICEAASEIFGINTDLNPTPPFLDPHFLPPPTSGTNNQLPTLPPDIKAIALVPGNHPEVLTYVERATTTAQQRAFTGVILLIITGAPPNTPTHTATEVVKVKPGRLPSPHIQLLIGEQGYTRSRSAYTQFTTTLLRYGGTATLTDLLNHPALANLAPPPIPPLPTPSEANPPAATHNEHKNVTETGRWLQWFTEDAPPEALLLALPPALRDIHNTMRAYPRTLAARAIPPSISPLLSYMQIPAADTDDTKRRLYSA